MPPSRTFIFTFLLLILPSTSYISPSFLCLSVNLSRDRVVFGVSQSSMTRPRAHLFSSKMVLRKEWQFDTPEQCRQRRRRRIEIRRARWSCSTLETLEDYITRQSTQHNSPEIINLEEEENEGPTTHAMVVPPCLPHQNSMPEFGTFSLIKRPDHVQISMEDFDTVFVKEDFFHLDDDVLGGQPLHFFAVFDGNGHHQVPTLCKQHMHEIVVEELIDAANGDGDLNMASQGDQQPQEEVEWLDLARTALGRSFQRMHWLAQDTCSCGNIGHTCGCKPNINAMPAAGCTAVVAILTRQHIVIANCGSTQAVLGRAGSPVPLSQDHESEKFDEQERMREVNGRIFNHTGVRVYGTLNMSHSLGPVVTLEPQISIIERQAGKDECLILADDGIWDVVPEDMACRVACNCLRHPSIKPVCISKTKVDEKTAGSLLTSSKSNVAATLLCRLALARGSREDMSVLVVDLKSG